VVQKSSDFSLTEYDFFDMRRRVFKVLKKHAAERGITLQELMDLLIPLSELCTVEDLLNMDEV